MAISFQQFMILAEAEGKSDTDYMDFSGSISANRGSARGSRAMSADDPNRKRMVTKIVNGKRVTVPVVQKPRKDIGDTRKAARTSERQEQPTQERGSADVKAKAAAAAKAERVAAARARIAARKDGGSTESKPSSSTSKDLESAATKLITKKKEEKPSGPKRTYRTMDHESDRTTQEKKKATDARRNQEQTASRQAMAPFVKDYIEKQKAAAKKEGRPWKAADSVRARAAAKAAYSKQS
jgi:hypothetical protein